VHIVCKYEKDFREALVRSVMAGGDNAARAMAVGMILGAHLGLGAVPQDWVSELKQKPRITALFDRLL
jgi:ADP-ribosylglycohydrolase